jgi:hypothetical protein
MPLPPSSRLAAATEHGPHANRSETQKNPLGLSDLPSPPGVESESSAGQGPTLAPQPVGGQRF